MDNTMTLIKQSHDGDTAARDRLIQENMGLVWSIVKRFTNRGYEPDDLFQIGCIGLIKSIDKFDLNYDVRFSTYAVPMIMGEIKRFLRDDGMIKVSRSLKETAGKVRNAKEQLTNQNGHEPTIEDIAREINITSEEIVMALDANLEVESLNKTIYQGEGQDIYLIDKIEKSNDESEEVVEKLTLQMLIDNLNETEKKIIVARYYQNKTQTEVAKELGMSQVQVSRQEKKILTQMRSHLIQ